MSKRAMNLKQIPNSYLTLEILFNSKIRVKILKFLYRNHPIRFGIEELADSVQEPVGSVRKEVKELERAGLIMR